MKKKKAKHLRGEGKRDSKRHQIKTEESDNYLVSVITISYSAGRWNQNMKNEEAFQDKQSSLKPAYG